MGGGLSHRLVGSKHAALDAPCFVLLDVCRSRGRALGWAAGHGLAPLFSFCTQAISNNIVISRETLASESCANFFSNYFKTELSYISFPPAGTSSSMGCGPGSRAVKRALRNFSLVMTGATAAGAVSVVRPPSPFPPSLPPVLNEQVHAVLQRIWRSVFVAIDYDSEERIDDAVHCGKLTIPQGLVELSDALLEVFENEGRSCRAILSRVLAHGTRASCRHVPTRAAARFAPPTPMLSPDRPLPHA